MGYDTNRRDRSAKAKAKPVKPLEKPEMIQSQETEIPSVSAEATPARQTSERTPTPNGEKNTKNTKNAKEAITIINGVEEEKENNNIKKKKEKNAELGEVESSAPRSRRDMVEDTIHCWSQALVSAVAGVVLIFTFLLRLIGVSGGSMQNTLYTGDRLVVLNAPLCNFKAGDVVVINDYNAELNETLVKRIIAVGGQTIDIDFLSGTVYVDGEALDEPYVKEPTYINNGTEFPLTLEEDEVFVMGDNRNHSTDSRSVKLGPVKIGYLQGKAVLLLSPGPHPDTGEREWSRIGWLYR